MNIAGSREEGESGILHRISRHRKPVRRMSLCSSARGCCWHQESLWWLIGAAVSQLQASLKPRAARPQGQMRRRATVPAAHSSPASQLRLCRRVPERLSRLAPGAERGGRHRGDGLGALGAPGATDQRKRLPREGMLDLEIVDCDKGTGSLRSPYVCCGGLCRLDRSTSRASVWHTCMDRSTRHTASHRSRPADAGRDGTGAQCWGRRIVSG